MEPCYLSLPCRWVQAWTRGGLAVCLTFLSVAPAVGKGELTVCVWRWVRDSQIARVSDGIMWALQAGRGYLKCREDYLCQSVMPFSLGFMQSKALYFL